MILVFLVFSGGTAGSVGSPPDEAVRFDGTFEAGAYAFLVELGPGWQDPPPGTVIEVEHIYFDDGFGATSPFATNFLVPLASLEEGQDLWPGNVNNPVPRIEWSHHYGVSTFWPSQHIWAHRTQEEHHYINPNDDGSHNRALSYRPYSVLPDGLGPGHYWWVFTATTPQEIEFVLPDSQLVEGPIGVGHHEYRLLSSSEEFETDLFIGSHPFPATGASTTLGAKTEITVQGPAYLMAHGLYMGLEDTVDYRLLSPGGQELEMRQKGHLGAVAGPLVFSEAHNTQADLLIRTDGAWQVEFDTAVATWFDFRFFVLDLGSLPGHDAV